MTAPVLRIEDVVIQATRSGTAVIDGVSLDIAKGEVLALIGASGSGKTTLGLTALGHTRPGLELRSGRVLVGGTEVMSARGPALRSLRGRIVAYVAQSAAAAFNPRLKLDAQVVEPSLVHGLRPRAEAVAIAWKHYRNLDLPMPDRIGDRYPHEVSGGQLQRFMIAMGLQEAPLLLVCDEPTSALDVTTQVGVLSSLKRGIRDEGSAALFVSHDLAVVAQIADRIAVLRNGRLVELGDTQQILSAPREAYTRELLGACRHLAGAAPRPVPPPRADDALLRVRGVSAGFGRKRDGSLAAKVLDDVDVAVRRGCITAVIGESGSGKSTLASVVAGLHPAASGEVFLGGKPLAPHTTGRSLEERRRIQLVFQSADTALNQKHEVGRILGRVLRFFKPGLSGPERERRVAELLAMVQLPAHYAGRQPRQLSGGEKQRINLARALAAEPDVLICDEITSALDTVVAASIIDLIETLRDRLGLAILFISHDLATVASLADEVTVLRRGRTVEQGATATVLTAPRSAYTRLLISSVPELRVGWLEDAAAARAVLREALEAEGSLPEAVAPSPPGDGPPLGRAAEVAAKL